VVAVSLVGQIVELITSGSSGNLGLARPETVTM